jgi:hypothetical protein
MERVSRDVAIGISLGSLDEFIDIFPFGDVIGTEKNNILAICRGDTPVL